MKNKVKAVGCSNHPAKSENTSEKKNLMADWIRPVQLLDDANILAVSAAIFRTLPED